MKGVCQTEGLLLRGCGLTSQENTVEGSKQTPDSDVVFFYPQHITQQRIMQTEGATIGVATYICKDSVLNIDVVCGTLVFIIIILTLIIIMIKL